MTSLLVAHSILGFIFALVIHFLYGADAAISVIAGAGVSLLNLIALVYSWPRILAKKLVALSIGVIVFKFAILGWIIFEVVKRELFHLGWFSFGLGLVVLSVVISSLQKNPNSTIMKADN